MKTFLRLLSLVVVATVLLSSCGQQDEAAPSSGKDEVVVHLSAGDAATTAGSATRAAFTESKPVTVLVYRRSDNNLQSAQYSELYKRVEGTVTTATSTSSGLSAVSFPSGDLTVEGGHTYDFVLVVNMPKDATVSNGVITNIPNDADIMVGRADNYDVPTSAYSIDVSFNKGYSTDNQGNLPHLASKVVVNATADDNLLGGNSIKMGIGSVKFYGVQGKASFNFGATPMVGLTLNGKSGSYFELVNSSLYTDEGNIIGERLTLVSSSSDKATYDRGTLLPMPLATGAEKNTMDIDFTVYFNNGGSTVTSTVLSAKQVELPEFKAGYQYTFNIVMKGKSNDDIDLYLSVTPWNPVSWDDGGIGGDSSSGQLLNVKVGSWTSASYYTTIGDTGNKIIFLTGVGGWSGLNWNTYIGK